MRPFYCYVRLENFRHEWRTVEAAGFEDARILALAMPDVVWVLEVSIIPSGVVT